MKFTKFVLLSILFVSLFFFLHTLFLQSDLEKLFKNDKDYYTLNYKGNPNSISKTITDWQNFSQKNDVVIGALFFNSPKQLTLYQTSFNGIIQKKLIAGKADFSPLEQKILTNYESKEKNKINALKMPSQVLQLDVAHFSEIQDNGLPSSIFIEGQKVNQAKTVRYLSRYAEVKKSDDSPLFDFSMQYTLFGSIFVLTLILYLLTLYYAIDLQAKKVAIINLFSRRKRTVYGEMIKRDLLLAIPSIIVVLLLIQYGSSLFHATFYQEAYIYATLSYLALLTLVTLISVLILFRKSKVVSLQTNRYVKGFQFTKKLGTLNFITLLLLFLFLCVAIAQLSQQLTQHKKERAAFNVWDQAKNVYKINYQDDLEQNDIKKEYMISVKIMNLYKQLSKLKKIFIIDASNFLLTPEHPYRFSFEGNVKSEKDIYGMSGNSILIDENYLSHNKMKSLVDIPAKLKRQENVLNALVPRKLKNKETLIKNTLLEDFYERNVEWKNTLYQKVGKPLVRLKKQDLKVNLVYIDNNQRYFTFSPQNGIPEKGYSITDPIAIILNPSIAEGLIGDLITSSAFVEDHSQSKAYQNLLPILQKTDTQSYITSTFSVYNEAGDKIAYIENKIKVYTLSFIVALIFIFVLLSYQIYTHYKIYAQRINIQILNGNSFFTIYKGLFFKTVCAQLFIIAAVSGYFQSWLTFSCGIVFIFVELILMLVQCALLHQKSVHNLLRRL